MTELNTAQRNTIETDRNCAIRSYRVYGKTVIAKLYEDDNTLRYFHLYFNPSKQAAEREQLEQLLARKRSCNLLKETMLRLETKPNYMTVPATLCELEKPVVNDKYKYPR